MHAFVYAVRSTVYADRVAGVSGVSVCSPIDSKYSAPKCRIRLCVYSCVLKVLTKLLMLQLGTAGTPKNYLKKRLKNLAHPTLAPTTRDDQICTDTASDLHGYCVTGCLCGESFYIYLYLLAFSAVPGPRPVPQWP